MRNPSLDVGKLDTTMATSASSSLDVAHVKCDIQNEQTEKKIKRLMRADSDVSGNANAIPPRPFLKEIKRQNSVGDVLSVILNKSRAQINSLFSKKLMTSERRQSQVNGKHFPSPTDPAVCQEKQQPSKKPGDSKNCEEFSSILNESSTDSKWGVPNIKPSLSPTLSNIQSGQLKPHFRFGTDTSPVNGPWKTPTKTCLEKPSNLSINALNCQSLSNFPALKPREVKNEMVRILSYLYLGSIEAAYNESSLCKANINALVDIANVPPNFTVPGRKLECPCFCVDKLHFRSKLYIAVDDIEWENMEQYFEEINNFIEGARKSHKSVLVYSYHGKSRSAAAVVQYLMSHFRISLDLAYRTVKCRKPDVAINLGLWKALERLDKKIIEEEKTIIQSCQISKSAPPTVRDAWLEC